MRHEDLEMPLVRLQCHAHGPEGESDIRVEDRVQPFVLVRGGDQRHAEGRAQQFERIKIHFRIPAHDVEPQHRETMRLIRVTVEEKTTGASPGVSLGDIPVTLTVEVS